MKFLFLLFSALLATQAKAQALDNFKTFCAANSSLCNSTDKSLLIVKGASDSNFYIVEADPATGEIPVSSGGSSPPSHPYADSASIDFSSTNVTSGAWVQLDASTAAAFTRVTLFSSCGFALELGIGAAASETRTLIIPPGGIDGQFDLTIAATTRLSLRALSTTCSTGELHITGLQ